MNQSGQHPEEMATRLRKLERQYVRLRNGVAAIILLVVSTMIVATKPGGGDSKVVEAERFILKSNGYYRGELGVSPVGTPMLLLTGAADSSLVSYVPESTCGVFMFDAFGRSTLSLQIGHRDDPSLKIGDSVSATITPGQFMVYKDGVRSWVAPTKN